MTRLIAVAVDTASGVGGLFTCRNLPSSLWTSILAELSSPDVCRQKKKMFVYIENYINIFQFDIWLQVNI